jgi:hypothetical protein
VEVTDAIVEAQLTQPWTRVVDHGSCQQFWWSKMMKTAKIALSAGLMLSASATLAAADMAVGLVGDNTLVLIDSAKRTVTNTMTVSGAGRLLGIDVRPANRQLYGVMADGSIVTIDTTSGKTTAVSKLDKMLPANVDAIVDFNPVADKLRLMGADGTNLRVDVDSGKVTQDGNLAFEAEDMHAKEKPNIVAGAYTNSSGKPEKTALYDVDATIGALIQQTKPNDGTLKAIGKFGIDKAKTYALDIQAGADGTNTAWLIADNKLYTVALDTGKATLVGEITGAKGMIRDVAVLPKS